MKLNDFVRNYREREGLSQREFALRCKMSHSYISMFEIGKNPATGKKLVPTGETLRKLAAGMRMTVDDLVKQVDDFIVNIQPDPDPLIYGLMPMPPQQETVPRLGRIHCGEPVICEENIEGYDEKPEGMKCDFTLLCEGDSMIEAGINDGDLIYIRQQPEVENGEIAAVLIDNEATLKRFFRYSDRVELRAENPTFRTLTFVGPEMARLRVIGKAVAFASYVR